MTIRTFTAMVSTAALTILTAVPATGQEHGQTQGHDARGHGAKGHGEAPAMMRGMRGGMMGGDHGVAMHAAMAFGPGPMMLLHQKEALGLSEAQTSRLDSLRAAMHARMEEHHAGMEEIHDAMEELASSKDPDMERFRELMQRMADARVELAVRMARTHRLAMDVLTPEQRSKARYGMELMHRMMKRHHGDGGHHMMGGGR